MKNIIKKALLFTLCAVLLLQLSGVSFAEADPPGTRYPFQDNYEEGVRLYRDAEFTDPILTEEEFGQIPVGSTVYYQILCDEGQWVSRVYVIFASNVTENSFVVNEESFDEYSNSCCLTFTIVKHEIGICMPYGDKTVDIKDAMWVVRYIAGWQGTEEWNFNGLGPNYFDPYGADYNCDGKINVKDVAAILKYIADPETPRPYGGVASGFKIVDSWHDVQRPNIFDFPGY